MNELTTTTVLGSPAPAPCPGCAELRRRVAELERRLAEHERGRREAIRAERLRARCHPEAPEGGPR